MATRYRIFAYSKLHNTKQQSMDLQNDTQLANPQYAQQVANSFAQRLNHQIFMGSNDWVGSTEPYEHVENSGYNFNLPNNPMG
jgi:hypothetical protein